VVDELERRVKAINRVLGVWLASLCAIILFGITGMIPAIWAAGFLIFWISVTVGLVLVEFWEMGKDDKWTLS